MLESAFYHNTTRAYTVAFGSIFNGIRIERENKSGEVVDTIPVPLMYADKEKFIMRVNNLSSISPEEVKVKETLPAMGFELANMTYAANRKTNTMERISSHDPTTKFMFNRVPYDFNFNVYIAARRVDDALRIVEQILPYFTPELNLRMKTMKDFPDMVDDIPVILDSSSFDIDAQGTFDDRRLVQWQLNFTLKGYLYANVRDVSVIKKTIIDLSASDINTFYEGYMSQVDPLNAGINDDHEVLENITTDQRDSQVASATGGGEASVGLD